MSYKLQLKKKHLNAKELMQFEFVCKQAEHFADVKKCAMNLSQFRLFCYVPWLARCKMQLFCLYA